MEPNDIKLAWAALGKKLERHEHLQFQLLRERKLDVVRSHLRRTYWSKIAQILFGDALIFWGITSAIQHHAEPHLLACSALVLAYGLLAVVFGGVTLGKISGIDYTVPVLDIQKHVAALRRIHHIGKRCLGLPWWFLWIAIFTLQMKANMGIDLFASAPVFLCISGAIGVAGFIATTLYFRRRNARPNDAPHDMPRSLRDAGNQLDEISRFERE